MIAIRKGIPISDCWKCQFVFLIHGGEVSGVPGCTLCVEGAPCSAFVEEKVGPESTESRKGQNTSRGSPGGSGLRRGAWKNKGGYPRKPASKNYPKEGLHLAGMSRQENVLGIGMEVLALTRPPPTRVSPTVQEPGSTKTVHTPWHDRQNKWSREPSSGVLRRQLWVPCLGKWIQHVLSGAFYPAPFGGGDREWLRQGEKQQLCISSLWLQ